jgi:transcriptional regulator with PAS, ATPase and Fis domain
MPLEAQVKLLRVLETRTLLRVGGSENVATDVRVIAASNRPPMQAVNDGKLREDLFYRLNVFPIEMPALRSRGSDAALIAEQVIAELNKEAGQQKHLSRRGPQAGSPATNGRATCASCAT